MSARVLIVDDDANLVEGLRWYLEAEGYEVTTASDGEAAIEAFRASHPDLIILDIMMPKVDGIRVCEIVSKESDSMIMMLSAKDSDIDKVRALRLGADDYVTKPFSTTELVAKVQALVRRHNRGRGVAEARIWRNLELSVEEHRVKVDGIVVDLTSMEFDLLLALMSHPQAALSREQLVVAIWGDDFYGQLRLVDNLVCRLRDKLARVGCTDFPIATVRGVGYAYRPEG